MFDYSAIVNPHRNLQILVSEMRRNSLRIAPVSAIPQTSLTLKHQTSSYDTWSDTNTGRHWKWSQPAVKSPPPEILPDRSSDTDHFHSRNSVNAMLTQLKIWRSLNEKPDFKTPRTDRTVSQRMIRAYREIGNINSNRSSTMQEAPTTGLSLEA